MAKAERCHGLPRARYTRTTSAAIPRKAPTRCDSPLNGSRIFKRGVTGGYVGISDGKDDFLHMVRRMADGRCGNTAAARLTSGLRSPPPAKKESLAPCILPRAGGRSLRRA